MLARFNVFGDLEHISTLKDVFLPRIAKFAEEVDILTQHNKDQRICIEEFDKSLSLKCNKSVIPLLETKLEDKFINLQQYHIMNSNFEGMQKVLKEREDKINVEI